jgi:serine/threonine protein kinase/tetratricopeptide (TPR) repeat protein
MGETARSMRMAPEHTSDQHRLHRIVDAVMDLPPEARPAAIEALCAGDAQLAAAVQRAVAPDEQETLEQTLARRAGAAATVPTRGLGADTLGPYHLLERLGEGAFGEVYVAEQSEPVRRKVAVKVLKPGMGSRQIIARFEAERQALALMDHPNIAKVFDAGTTPLGLPYFVMELVRGQPITDYCNQQRLSLRERLELMIPVCRAVQHAHQRGVIHRDLKPGNVLVTVLDGKPVPKVIDFGIAKAIGPALTDATIYTQFRQLIGTPAYMSPEQMAISAADVDTRSDVYSLGAMLYELVAGRTPFDAETLVQAGIDEMRRVIRESDPPKPSTRLSTMDAASLSAIAERQRASPQRLSRLLAGEVDWIVLRAIEKDRARRYQSPLDLAADIESFLAGRAVSAGPPSGMYRLRKFLRRHRVAVAIVGVAILGLAATAVGTGIGLKREAAARRDAVANERIARENERLAREGEAAAQAERLKAEESARDASDALQVLTGIIFAADPARVGGRKDMTVGEMLDQLVTRLDQVESGKAPPLQPRVVMRLRSDAARVYYWQGRVDDGKVQAAKGLALAESLYGPDSLEAAKAIKAVVAGYWFGRGPTAEGERLARRALDIFAKHGQGDSIEAIVILHDLVLMIHAQGRTNECGDMCRDLIRRYEAMEEPPVVGYATAYADLALSDLARGRAEAALAQIEKCIQIYESGLDEQARRQYISRPYTVKANVLLALGRLDEAEQASRTSMAISDAIRGPDHPYPMFERRSLISVLTERGKIDEARTLTDAYERILAASGGTPGLAESVRRALLLRRGGQHEQSLALWEQARAALARVRAAASGGAPAPSTISPADIAEGFAERLGVLTDLGRPRDGLAEASAAYADARAFFAGSGDDVPGNWRLRKVAAELLRAYEAVGDEPSRDAARQLRERYPDLKPAAGFKPTATSP